MIRKLYNTAGYLSRPRHQTRQQCNITSAVIRLNSKTINLNFDFETENKEGRIISEAGKGETWLVFDISRYRPMDKLETSV